VEEVLNLGDKKAILVSGLASCLILLGLPAFSLPSDSEAVDALEKAKILAPTIRMNARLPKTASRLLPIKTPKQILTTARLKRF
jgi:hypothetical protein